MAKNSTADAIISALGAVTRDSAKQRKAEERHASAVRNRYARLVRSRESTVKEVAAR